MRVRVGLDLSCLLAQPWTGVGYYTYPLFRALLAREEVEGRVFAASARPDAKALGDIAARAEAVRVVRFPTRLRTALWTRLGWPPIERFTGPVDIAHGAFHLLPPARAAKRIVTIFDLAAFLHPATRTRRNAALHRRLIAHAARRADRVITLSECVRAEVMSTFGLPPARVAVVPGAVSFEEIEVGEAETQEVRRRCGIPEDYFIHIGTLEPRKNLGRLLHAVARVHAQRPCPPLVLVGGRGWMDGPLLHAIGGHGDKIVRHVGYLPRRDAIALLRGARACLYPSLYEGFGLPVLEAMAAGTPVLTSVGTSMAEVTGDTALLVAPADEGAITEGIVALLDEPDAARARAERARERARAYTWERAAEALVQAYRQTLGEDAGIR